MKQVKELKEHISRVKNIYASAPKSREFIRLRKKNMYLLQFKKLLIELEESYDLRESQGLEVESIKIYLVELSKKFSTELTIAIDNLYRRLLKNNIKRDYGIQIPTVPKMLYVDEKLLKKLNEYSTQLNFDLDDYNKNRKRIEKVMNKVD